MKHTIKELIDIRDFHKYGGYSIDKLKTLIHESSMYASSRRSRSVKALERQGLPLPNVYRIPKGNEKTQSWRTTEFNITPDDLKGTEREIKAKLRKKFKQNVNFLSTETSTISGWKRTINKYTETIIQKSGLNESDKKKALKTFKTGKYFDLIWRTFNRLEEHYKDITVTGASSQMLYQLIENIDSYDDIESLYSKMAKIYADIEDRNLEEEEEIFPEGVNLAVDFRRRRKGKVSVKPLRDI